MIRIAFCGACNPVFSLKELASKVREKIPDDTGGEVVLLLNGCRTGCLKPENFAESGDIIRSRKVIYVAGMSVNGLETEENDLFNMVVNAVKNS